MTKNWHLQAFQRRFATKYVIKHNFLKFSIAVYVFSSPSVPITSAQRHKPPENSRNKTFLFQYINNSVTDFAIRGFLRIFAQKSNQKSIIVSETHSTSGPKILLVDEDASITSMLVENLRTEGYTVEVKPSAEEALMLPLDTYNLIITEINLPGEIDGFELLERLKEDTMTAHVPLIFCTVRDSEKDIIEGLNSGADDFITRPFSLREMLARVRSVLRRHRNMAPAVTSRTIEFRSLVMNIDNHALLVEGSSVSLTPTESAILILLMRSRNHLFSREEIHAAGWPGEEFSNPRLVDVNISRLRKKLGPYARNIVNRSGRGYGFMDEPA